MEKITRTPIKATGGITPEEKIKMDAIADKWIKNTLRTDKADIKEVERSITALYAAAGLKKPRIVLVPSPFVGRLASGISAAIWHLRKNSNTNDAATSAATSAATYAVTHAATDAATDAATYAATYAATDTATRDATYNATDFATDAAIDAAIDAANSKKSHWLLGLVKTLTPNAIEFTLRCIKLSYRFYQGGNMWGYWQARNEAMRDVLGLTGLDVWDKYQAWEDAAKAGGFRYMHEEFCIVSDFPEKLEIDEQNRPHSLTGPSHRWRDGFEIYHINGVRFDDVDLYWKIVKDELTAEQVFAIENMEQRRIAYELMDKLKMKELANYKVLDHRDEDEQENMDEVVSFDIDGFDEPFIYYHCECPTTGRRYFLQTKEETCQKAKSASFGLESDVEWINEW